MNIEREAKKLNTQHDELQRKIADLRETRQQIIEASTAEKLKRVDRELSTLQDQLSEVGIERNRLVAHVPKTDRQKELTSAIAETLHQEQSVIVYVGTQVPEKFVHPAAVQKLEEELEAAERKWNEVNAQCSRHQFMRPSGQSLDYRRRVEDLRHDFPRLRRLAEAGEKIYAIREHRKAMIQERDQLAAAREAVVVNA